MGITGWQDRTASKEAGRSRRFRPSAGSATEPHKPGRGTKWLCLECARGSSSRARPYSASTDAVRFVAYDANSENHQ